MAKDKKKKKNKGSKGSSPAKAKDSLKALAQNPLVADVVAAALVATASALKDSNKARKLASEAGDEITKLSKAGAEKGNALWEMALQIGRRSLETMVADNAAKRGKSKSSGKKNARAKGGSKSSSN